MKRCLSFFLAVLLLACAFPAFAETERTETFRVLGPEDPPAFVTERKLTDEEIEALAGADLDTLKNMISTYGDFVAWTRIVLFSRLDFYNRSASNSEMQYTFGAQFSYAYLSSGFSPNMTVSVAQYVLEDDFPGIGTLFILLKPNELVMKCANYLPMEGGYYLLNAEQFIEAGREKASETYCACLMDAVFVSALGDVIPYIAQSDQPFRVIQVLALETADTIVLDPGDDYYIPQDTPHVTTVFLDENSKYPPEGSSIPFESYGFPDQLRTDSEIDSETAKALAAGTYEEAAAAIKTIPDVMNYLYYTGYTRSGYDMRVETHDGEWHYNYKPQVVFARGKGNCGGTSALIAGLLEGDYDEVGMITLRFANDGHVINYVRDGEQYYVFDGVGWVGCGFQDYGLSFSCADSLKKAAMQYGELNDTRQMVAYVNPKGGDRPVIFLENATLLPSHYCDLTILQETKEEGYVYVFVEEDPAIMDAIDAIRGAW